MKLSPFYIQIIFILISSTSVACSCNSAGEFLTVAPKSDMVSLVKVIRYLTYHDIQGKPMPMSMEVEVIDVYKGVEAKKTITVWGDNGALCRPYLSTFTVGQYYVVAFGRITRDYSDDRQSEKANDYEISICGDYWLQVDKEQKNATGPVTNKLGIISLTDLKTKFK